jgi:hypothetical protein
MEVDPASHRLARASWHVPPELGRQDRRRRSASRGAQPRRHTPAENDYPHLPLPAARATAPIEPITTRTRSSRGCSARNVIVVLHSCSASALLTIVIVTMADSYRAFPHHNRILVKQPLSQVALPTTLRQTYSFVKPPMCINTRYSLYSCHYMTQWSLVNDISTAFIDPSLNRYFTVLSLWMRCQGERSGHRVSGPLVWRSRSISRDALASLPAPPAASTTGAEQLLSFSQAGSSCRSRSSFPCCPR